MIKALKKFDKDYRGIVQKDVLWDNTVVKEFISTLK